MDSVRPGIGETGLVQASWMLAGPGEGKSAPGGTLTRADIATLEGVAVLLHEHPATLLTGAGLSTDSGIPDYRGPTSPPRQPLQYQEFMGEPLLRQRYWARNHVGWAQLHHAQPNTGHYAARALERGGHLSGIITQNVDRLHELAGASNVVDLHGRYDKIICMACSNTFSRAHIATLLTELNPGFLGAVSAAGGVSPAPDADAELDSEKLIRSFRPPTCPLCAGLLKPDFVFFGENVPKDRVERSYQMVDAGHLLLVAGSSLTVMSGLRFVKKAAKDGKAVVIINRGPTRGDSLATVKLEAGVSESLGWLADALKLDWRNH